MRLGDLDALKKHAFTVQICNGVAVEEIEVVPLAEIDNAPTVEERPQGEWKVNHYGDHICPICGHYALYKEEYAFDYYEVQSNFCPECGADLRGDKNETDN